MQAGSRRTQEEEEEVVGVPCFLRRLTCWFVGAAWLHVCHRSWRLVWQWREDEWEDLVRQELWSSLWSHLLCLSLQPYQSSPPIFSLLHPVSVHNNVFPIHTANNQVPFEHRIPLKTRTFFNNPQIENLAEKEEDLLYAKSLACSMPSSSMRMTRGTRPRTPPPSILRIVIRFPTVPLEFCFANPSSIAAATVPLEFSAELEDFLSVPPATQDYSL